VLVAILGALCTPLIDRCSLCTLLCTHQPNCFARYITVDGVKHVVIVARYKIIAGEELTYDYHMPIEDVKIPCRCGSSMCRGTMN